MQKNQINTSEEKDLSLLSKIKNLALSLGRVPALIKMVDAIKSPKIKKQALALFVSAVMLTSAGCGEITPETQETNQIIHENTESDYAETSVLEKYEDVDGYVSDLANEILNDPKYPEYKATYNEEKQNPFDCYDTSLNPVCFRYYNNLYPNATNEDLINYTRVAYEFYCDGSFFIVCISSPLLSDNIEGEYMIEFTKVYTMLEFPNLTKEETRDLIKSRQDNDVLTHTLLLQNIFDNQKFNIAGENVNGMARVFYYDIGLDSDKVTDFSFLSLKKDGETKYMYSLVEMPDGEIALYYSESKLTKDEIAQGLKIQDIMHLCFSKEDNFYNNINCGNIEYYTKIKDSLKKQTKENTYQ